MSELRKFIVSEDANIVRVDKFLAEQMPEFSRSEIQKFSISREDGAPLKMSEKIRIGDVFIVEIPEKKTDVATENISSDFYKWWLDVGASFENGYSFPSGHTTATTAFAMAIFLTTNKKYSWPIVLLPIFMACSRIYLMVHYFSDCVGGLIVGTACATTAWFVIKMIYSSKWKFFVWIREFDIFKRRAVQTSSSSSAKQGEQSSPSEDYVYTPQGDEKSSDAPTSETDTDKDN